jgi:hypothetical protein
MKAKIVLKSFPGHQGIPGHQGGSLPKGEGNDAIATIGPELQDSLGKDVIVTYRLNEYTFDNEKRNRPDFLIEDTKSHESILLEPNNNPEDTKVDLFIHSIAKTGGHGILGVRVVRALKKICDDNNLSLGLYSDNARFWPRFDWLTTTDKKFMYYYPNKA